LNTYTTNFKRENREVLRVVDISTVSIVLASTSVMAAAIYYILQIRHQTRVRQTDLVIRLYSTFASQKFMEAWHKIYLTEFKDYDDFGKKLGGKRWPVLLFYEEVGVLLHRKLIDIGLVDDLLGNSIRQIWEKIRHVMEEARKRYDPRFYKYFEYLYNEMKKREQQQTKIG